MTRREGRVPAMRIQGLAAAAPCLVLLAAGFSVPVQAQESAAAGSLVQAPGWELVYAHCSACHSLQLVTSQRGDEDTWRRLIRWMQATQNLWELDPATEAGIVGYLAQHYAPRGGARRPPLSPDLMPPG